MQHNRRRGTLRRNRKGKERGLLYKKGLGRQATTTRVPSAPEPKKRTHSAGEGGGQGEKIL